MYSCEKEDSTIIDPILNIPSLDSVNVSPVTFDTSRINMSLRAYVTSVDPIQQVSARFLNPDGSLLANVNLNLEGTSYAANFDTLLPCWLVGDYKIEFVAVTASGLNSNTIIENFTVINSNSIKPAIYLIFAPDSLQRASGNPGDTLRPAFLKVQVIDPDGPCDIREAYFNSINPLGVPNQFNPFAMYDNGNVNPPYCDTVANDGKFSLMIYIGSTATLGNYTFKFNARDKSFVVSDTLYKVINVYP
jgi:hypothetical protein